MGVTLTPAPMPPPKGLSPSALLLGKSVPAPPKPTLTLETGMMVTPSGVVIGSPTTELTSTISLIF